MGYDKIIFEDTAHLLYEQDEKIDFNEKSKQGYYFDSSGIERRICERVLFGVLFCVADKYRTLGIKIGRNYNDDAESFSSEESIKRAFSYIENGVPGGMFSVSF